MGKEFVADEDAVESYMNVGEPGCEFQEEAQVVEDEPKVEDPNIVRGTKAMGYARAKVFCKSQNMVLPRPKNDAENNKAVSYGETWLDVLVNALLDEDREYGNWERRLRAYLNNHGKWEIAQAADEREFYCINQKRSNTCASQMNADWFQGGNWQLSNKGTRYFSQMTAADLDTLSFGSRVRFNCAFGRSQSYICVRDRNGGQFFAKCKNRSCGTFVRRRVNFDSDYFTC